MSSVETITATEFKAKCLDIMDRLADGRLQKLVVTKRGKPVATLTPPERPEMAIASLYGCMKGSVTIPEGFDLTAPVYDGPWDAELGILHR